uniref:Uncharacterized protein n=1 Tax=Rhizophora mucronata TaxID=61149 RepID=A0A2P2N2U6_RHIMU
MKAKCKRHRSLSSFTKVTKDPPASPILGPLLVLELCAIKHADNK